MNRKVNVILTSTRAFYSDGNVVSVPPSPLEFALAYGNWSGPGYSAGQFWNGESVVGDSVIADHAPGPCNQDWCEVEADRHEGWVVKADIWGVGKDEVIE